MEKTVIALFKVLGMLLSKEMRGSGPLKKHLCPIVFVKIWLPSGEGNPLPSKSRFILADPL